MYKKRQPRQPGGWTHIETSAPGRVILIGEYGDLEDKNAIAVAINSRLKVTLRPNDDGLIRLNMKDFCHVREFPTTLPILSLSKLVANYTDTFTYTEFIARSLKPLLQKKYHKTKVTFQEPLKYRAAQPCDIRQSKMPSFQTASSSSSMREVPQPSATIQSTLTVRDPIVQLEGLQQEQNQQDQAIEQVDSDEDSIEDDEKLQIEISNDDKELGPIYLHEVSELADRQLESLSQTDQTTLAFFMLYISIGDSFAGSARPAMDVEISSDIPMCRGLGSSTALAVALCGALMRAFSVSAEPTVIIDWAHNIDKFFHYQVTTLHSCVVTLGGYIYYQKDKVKSLGRQHTLPLKMMLIDSGLRRDPRQVNEIVVKKLREKNEFVDATFNSINDLASRIWLQMNESQFRADHIHQSLMIAQALMSNLGIKHDVVGQLERLAAPYAAVLKQSQAGETVFYLYDDELDETADRLARKLKDHKFTYTVQEISFKGLTTKIAGTPLVPTGTGI